MAVKSTKSKLANGLQLWRMGIDGTQAATVIVAFNAGARTEEKSENGMAHFLEHLVFKGGRKYPNYRAINDAAEKMGAVMNAYTSHDLVAFHITARAESVEQAADLLTDFVARPRFNADDIGRERGVVAQEIARAKDQPGRVADDLIDQATFGRHPLGRTVLGTVKRIRSFDRDQIMRFRKRRWGTSRAAAFVVGNLSHAPKTSLEKLFNRFPKLVEPPRHEPVPIRARTVLTSERDTNQSHLRLLWRPYIDLGSERERAAFSVYSTILGGSMGSRLFDEIREQRGLCYSISAQSHELPDAAFLYVSSGLESKKCLEAYGRIREVIEQLTDRGPNEEELVRARAYLAGKLILAFESTGAVARYAADRAVVFGDSPDPSRAVREIEKVQHRDVVEIASRVEGKPVVACVGPHKASDFN